MTLTKNEMISKIREELELPLQDATETVEHLLEIIKPTLESDEDVLISGFGKFCVKSKNARKGRNPATGEDMTLDAGNVITFKNSGKLLDRLNGNK